MLENIPEDLKTHAFVLRRTNYGEADRIINLISPVGKIAVMAKGVRKPKSKLAGGIEMFSLTNVNLHFGKSEMAVLTGAKMEKFYGEILKDLTRMELASEMLKKINKASDSIDSAGFFEILKSGLSALDSGCDIRLVDAWFNLNLMKIVGEEVNLYRDINGEQLKVDLKYSWNNMEMAFYPDDSGNIDANVIKILRLLISADLDVVRRIKHISNYVEVLNDFSKMVVK